MQRQDYRLRKRCCGGNDPQHGEIFPKDFISVAEELCQLSPGVEWVFRTTQA
jgi:EAL domain-containing protein (putative c-di-GMP-specific phosphodiesterase class I)